MIKTSHNDTELLQLTFLLKLPIEKAEIIYYDLIILIGGRKRPMCIKNIWCKKLLTSFLALIPVLLILTDTFAEQQPSAEYIAQRIYDRDTGRDSHATVLMKLIEKDSQSRVREMEVWRRDFGEFKKTLIRFNSPAEIRGTGFLTWENKSRDDDQYLFLPELRRSRRIVSSQKDQKFVNSDFTYEDMQRRRVEKDVHHLLGSKILSGFNCWVLESTPKPSAESQYEKFVALVTRDSYVPIQIDYYKHGRVVKRYTVLNLQKIGGIWTDMVAEMADLRNQHRTVLEVQKISYNVNVDPNVFTVRNLEKY